MPISRITRKYVARRKKKERAELDEKELCQSKCSVTVGITFLSGSTKIPRGVGLFLRPLRLLRALSCLWQGKFSIGMRSFPNGQGAS